MTKSWPSNKIRAGPHTCLRQTNNRIMKSGPGDDLNSAETSNVLELVFYVSLFGEDRTRNERQHIFRIVVSTVKQTLISDQ